ncbi:FUSC family protein [Nocardia tengchongensis]|uniref:FUSC family protein n=1 Tax=Nocardia tengchongensis TaxID=2055889 RepID=UPI003690A03D
MHPWRGLVRELLSLAPRGDDHHYALRVALGLAIPGAMLVPARRTDILVFAAFGSFVGMYGRGHIRGSRVRHQLVAATVLGTGVVIGSAAQQTPAGHTAQQTAPAGWAQQAAVASTGQRVFTREELWHAGRYALAVALAGAGGVALGVAQANWAMAAADVPLAAGDSRGRVLRGVERVAGTFIGLGASALLLLPHPPPWLLGVSVLLLLFPTELFMARNYALALGFFTPLIMVMTELAAPADPVRLLLDRGTDTVLGVTVGVAVAVLTRPRTPDTVAQFRARTARFAR